ncbi:hypothetical protein BOTBODRAFT_234371 [Botryobasidium botryosum FD-172 SS1]|uniref:Uncharacterized protein n=1 Tax=Botryobasidium botryosum (strain FD-172 SS1) TaxID=930990 RepID=A0A067LU11_BOTB1|nr:hypothetical protein BOTBODRAFT_234371 [Botryobasidium botryosum FD-172 SS1]
MEERGLGEARAQALGGEAELVSRLDADTDTSVGRPVVVDTDTDTDTDACATGAGAVVVHSDAPTAADTRGADRCAQGEDGCACSGVALDVGWASAWGWVSIRIFFCWLGVGIRCYGGAPITWVAWVV